MGVCTEDIIGDADAPSESAIDMGTVGALGTGCGNGKEVELEFMGETNDTWYNDRACDLVVLVLEDIVRPRARIDALDSDLARDGALVLMRVALNADARVPTVSGVWLVLPIFGTTDDGPGTISDRVNKGKGEGEGGRVEVVDRGIES